MSVAVGRASVAVVPSFAGFQAALTEGMRPGQALAEGEGAKAGRGYGAGFSKGSKESVSRAPGGGLPVPSAKESEGKGKESGKQFGSGFLGSTKGVLEGLGAFAAFDFLKDAIKDGNQLGQTMAILGAHLKSTGGAAGLTAEDIKSLSEKTAELTGNNTQAELSAANMLLQFTNIKGSIYKDALPAVNDISVAMKIGMPQAAKVLGKALNDPAQGMSALSRVGIQFSASQKTQIKAWEATGQTAKAQALILAQVNMKMGGTAEAAATPIQKLKAAWWNFTENIGEMLIPMVNRLIQIFTTDVLPVLSSMANFVKNNTTVVLSFVGAMAALLVTMKLVKLATEAWEAIQVIGTAISKGWAAATWLVNAALSANPVVLVIAVIVALIAVIVAVIIKFHLWNGIVEAFKNAWNATWSFVKNIFHDVTSAIVHDVMVVVDWIKNHLWVLFAAGPIGIVIAAILFVISHIHTFKDAFVTAVNDIKGVWGKLQDILSAPVKFLVNTVYDQGIARIWNDTAGAVGLPKLPMEHFASGGRVGPAGSYGGGDRYPALLEAGEAVVPKHLAPSISPWLSANGVPGFSGGWNPWNAVKRVAHDIAHPSDAIKDIRNLAGDAAGAVVRGAYNTIVKPMLGGLGHAGGFSALLQAMPAKAIEAMVNAIKGHQDNAGGGVGSAIAGTLGHVSGNVASWIKAGMAIAGVSGPAWQNGLTYMAMMESGGNPNIVNTTDSNAKAGHPCVPLDTLILTKRGWLRYDAVRVGDQTIGYNPDTGMSEWTDVTGVHFYDSAPVVRLGNSRWSARVTPNHRWWSDSALKSGFRGEFVETQNINSTTRIRLAAVAGTAAVLPISNDEAELIGWLMGDGHVRSAAENRRVRDPQNGRFSSAPRGGLAWDGTVFQSKLEHVEHLRGLLVRTAPFSEGSRQRAPGHLRAYSFRIGREYMTDLVKRAGLDANGDFRSGAEAFVLSLGASQRSAFMTGMIAAEGNTSDGYTRIAQVDGPVQDAIRLAVYLEGFSPRVSYNSAERNGFQPCATIGMARPVAHGVNLNTESVGSEPVWCVSTILGTWTMQQDGLPCLTGNSAGLMQFIKSTFDAYAMPGHTSWMNPIDQVVADAWQHGYINSRYGGISGVPGVQAAAHGGAYVGYDAGGPLRPGVTLAHNTSGMMEGVATGRGLAALADLNEGRMGGGSTYISVKIGETPLNDLVDSRIEQDNLGQARLAEGSWSRL